MQTPKTPNFTRSIAKIITEVSAITGIDEVDAEAIEELLKAELNEQCMMLDGYYEEEYYNAISRARNEAYYEGHSDGYALGYDDGYSDSH